METRAPHLPEMGSSEPQTALPGLHTCLGARAGSSSPSIPTTSPTVLQGFAGTDGDHPSGPPGLNSAPQHPHAGQTNSGQSSKTRRGQPSILLAFPVSEGLASPSLLFLRGHLPTLPAGTRATLAGKVGRDSLGMRRVRKQHVHLPPRLLLKRGSCCPCCREQGQVGRPWFHALGSCCCPVHARHFRR